MVPILLFGVWWALAISNVLDGLYMWWRWRSNVWQTVALHKSEIYRTHLTHLPQATQVQFLETVRTPLMAVPDTLELVNPQGVRYQQPNRTVDVAFEQQSFKFV